MSLHMLLMSFLFIMLQAFNLSLVSSFNIVSACICLLYTGFLLGIVVQYIYATFRQEIVGFNYSEKKLTYTLAFYHKFPFIRDIVTKNYNTPWILSKIILILLIYHDMKPCVIIYSIIYPAVYLLQDIW